MTVTATKAASAELGAESSIATPAGPLAGGDVVEFSEKILARRYQKVVNTSVSIVVSTAFDTIKKYRDLGMTFEDIAQEYTESGVPMKSSTLRVLYGRAAKARANAEAATAKPSASVVAPTVIKETPSAASPASVLAPTPAPVSEPAPTARGEEKQKEVPASAPAQVPVGGVSQAHLIRARLQAERDLIKGPIDRLCEEAPPPDKEYPELLAVRFWSDSTGKKWDMATDLLPREMKGEDEKKFLFGKHKYQNAKNKLFESWGILNMIENRPMRRYDVAERLRRPLSVDLKKLVADHLD